MTRRAWLVAVGLLGCAKRPALPVFNSIPAFTLTDQTGAAFDGGRLTGKIWVANFMFTSCTATCPRQGTILQRVQRETAADLVSFTVDVARDTPEVLAAFTVSTIFLTSYLIYHYNVGSVKFQKEGPIRTVYLTILLTHTVLAVFVGIAAPMTLFRALKNRIPQHKKLARWTMPIWLYVSVTGVVVYYMLYQM